MGLEEYGMPRFRLWWVVPAKQSGCGADVNIKNVRLMSLVVGAKPSKRPSDATPKMILRWRFV